MSLLDKASLIVTPNAYKTSKLYSVIPNTALGDMDVVRATTPATRVNSAGLIESVGVNIPRIDYTNGSCPSILVEPLRTNLVTYNEDFSNASWTKINSLVTANTTISPSGVVNADSVINSIGTNQFSRVRQIPAVTIGQTYVYSCFFKKGDTNYANITLYDNADFYAFFNLNNGTTENISAGITANIQSYGNGWYRCSVIRKAITTGIHFSISLSNNSSQYFSNLNNFIYIWGAQVELGSYPTSIIPTVASIQTRNADVISKTGISSLIGQTEGTIYAEIKVNKLIGTASRYIFHISDGTVNNRIYMAFSGASSNVLRGRIFNGGTLQCSIDTSTITTTGTYKLALAYKNNDIVFYVNGVQIGVDTSATIPTCSRVDIGHNYAGASQLSDGVANANIFKTRLTNSELAQLTTL